MEAIAIIDDREAMRETIARAISVDLEELGLDWTVIPAAPLEKPDGYAAWVQEHGVCVIIFDENLSEDYVDAAVGYAGHDAVKILRTQKPDLPQFIVTSVAVQNEGLDSAAADLEDVIPRNLFEKNSSRYVQRMVRAGQSFSSRYESDLNELNRIAEAVVRNDATEADIAHANAIRSKLQIAYDIDSNQSIKEWLERAETQIESLENAIRQLTRTSNEGKASK